MNGWRRLYVGICVVAVLPMLALAGVSWPRSDSTFRAEGCKPSYYTTAAADESLRTGKWDRSITESNQCESALRTIAEGKRLAAARSEWIGNVENGAIAVAIVLALIYGAGWGIGWIWRGFFPPKPST